MTSTVLGVHGASGKTSGVAVSRRQPKSGNRAGPRIPVGGVDQRKVVQEEHVSRVGTNEG